MPTTKLKNAAYRMMLPLKAPKVNRNLTLSISSPLLKSRTSYVRLLRKHHVLGSACLLSDGKNKVMLYSSTEYPSHHVMRGSVFRVASITKMATALAALKAVEEGRINPDQPFLDYFNPRPSCRIIQDKTLLHLLSHTSGLIDPPELETALLDGLPFTQVISKCITDPGSENAFHYSNLGFGLVGCLLEAVYHLPVSVIFQQKVFDPLGMKATLDATTLNRQSIVPISRVLPFDPKNETDITPLGMIPLISPDPFRHYGHSAGAMYTDLESLEKLVQCLIKNGRPVLSGDIGHIMSERHAFYGKLDHKLHYGLGLLIIEDPSISSSRILGHQGFAYGCADGAFWEEDTGRMLLFLNGGASEARKGRLGLCNYDLLRWAFRKEIPRWCKSAK